jgi:hypothetical protein
MPRFRVMLSFLLGTMLLALPMMGQAEIEKAVIRIEGAMQCSL